MKPLIELINVTKTYRMGDLPVPVLKGVSCKIESGEYVALMGSSGSGKSTLMNILGCLDSLTDGEYQLEGRSVANLTPDERATIRNEKIGFVFQSFNLLARTSALDNVMMPVSYAKRPGANEGALEHARELLDMVGLKERADHFPSQLSGGQQQRVAIARSLINNPKILFADEPTGNLDSKTTEEVMQMFARLNEQGITIVLVTHELDVAQHAKRIIRLKDGQVAEDNLVEARIV